MKKIILLALLTCFMAMASACGSEEKADAAENGKELEAETGDSEEETSSVTGTIDEIKDFMFTMKAEDGNWYSFPIEGGTPDISGFKVDDKVTVTYTGQLSTVDAFTGQVISVEKAD